VKSYQIDGKVFTSTAKEETMVAVGSGVHSLIYSR
jgi:hypothetical protein